MRRAFDDTTPFYWFGGCLRRYNPVIGFRSCGRCELRRKVISMRDGLLKLADFPAVFGDTGNTIDED